jgi:hypothetical protein
VPNTLRHRIDQASLPLMTRLNGLPKLLPFAILLTLLVGGVLVGGLLGLVLMCLGALSVVARPEHLGATDAVRRGAACGRHDHRAVLTEQVSGPRAATGRLPRG